MESATLSPFEMYSDLLSTIDESDETCALLLLLSEHVTSCHERLKCIVEVNSDFIEIYYDSFSGLLESVEKCKTERLDNLPTKLDEIEQRLYQEIGNVRKDFFDKYSSTLSLVLSKSYQAINNFIFIGANAYEIKLKISDYIRIAESKLNELRGHGLTVTNSLLYDINHRVADFSCISETFNYFLTVLDIFDSDMSGVPIQRGADIPFVIEGRAQSAIGIYSKLFGGTALYFGGESHGTTTTKNICIQFNLGIIPQTRFKFEIAGESYFGDWVKWACGGFIFRNRPKHSFKLPDFGDKLTAFISTHVISQWSGDISLQSIETQLNSIISTDKNSIEKYAKYISF